MSDVRHNECKNKPHYFEMFLRETKKPCQDIRGRTPVKRDADTLQDNQVPWHCGITTVPSRFDNEFRRTLESLRQAGFGKPTIFVDAPKGEADYEQFGLPVVYRSSNIKTAGHWVLSAWELYIRNSHAEYFAMFQDDFVACKNLRTYIELSDPPKDGYLNLYTFPQNQRIADKTLKGKPGWARAGNKKRGLGAVALVFHNEVFRTLLNHQHIRDRFRSFEKERKHLRRDVLIDGGIVEAMNKAGFFEYVHSPSLVQHIGDKSTIANRKHPKAKSFRGEDFDALALLPEEKRPKSGLGDKVSQALSAVGITEERVTKWLGPCGCSERRQKLNKLGEWAEDAAKKSAVEGKRLLMKLIGK